MSPKKKHKSVVALCIQEPLEDGSAMDFGIIRGDDLRFLHQAFITDSIVQASAIPEVDLRLYYIDDPERKRLVKIVSDYLNGRAEKSKAFKNRFSTYDMSHERWGLRIEKVFEDCFADGYQHVVVVGSRTPTITGEMYQRVFRALEKSDAVFGPTPEGRYYLIGMNGKYHIKLSEYDWKSPTIYSEVVHAFSEQELAWSELEIWYTVERNDELEIMARDINQFRLQGDETTARETELVLERILTKLEP